MKTQSKHSNPRTVNWMDTGDRKDLPPATEQNHHPPVIARVIECNRQAAHTVIMTKKGELSRWSEQLRARIALNHCFYPRAYRTLSTIKPNFLYAADELKG
jgi:hypothetical protein